MDEIVEAQSESRSFLDSVGARLLALVLAIIAGYLLFLTYQYYRGTTGGMLGGVDEKAFQTCVEERLAAFDKLAGEAGYDAERRASAERAARASADVICAEQARPVNR